MAPSVTSSAPSQPWQSWSARIPRTRWSMSCAGASEPWSSGAGLGRKESWPYGITWSCLPNQHAFSNSQLISHIPVRMALPSYVPGRLTDGFALCLGFQTATGTPTLRVDGAKADALRAEYLGRLGSNGAQSSSSARIGCHRAELELGAPPIPGAAPHRAHLGGQGVAD